MQRFKDFISSHDIFAAEPALRAHGEPVIANFCGGMFSMLFIGLIGYMITDMTVNTVMYKKIESQEWIKSDGKSFLQKNISFIAIGFQQYTMQQMKPYFEIFVKKANYGADEYFATKVQEQYFELEPCNQTLWEQYETDERVLENLRQMKCIKNSEAITITNDRIDGSETVKIEVKACKDKDYCAESHEFFNFFKSKTLFQTSFYILNTAFDPSEHDPLIYDVKLFNLPFSYIIRRGGHLSLMLSHYQIQTDESFLPFQVKNELEGVYISDQLLYSTQLLTYEGALASVYLKTDRNIKVIERLVGKFDEILAYVGGFIDILVVILGFFLFSFNDYRYELLIGEHAFNYRSDGKKFKEKEFTFLYYIKYSFYDWIDTFFCCHLLQRGRCKEINQTREQAVAQLDVKYLFKRLQYYEKAFQYLLSHQEIIALQLTEPPSLQIAQKKRKIIEYYNQMIQGGQAVTIEDIEILEGEVNQLQQNQSSLNSIRRGVNATIRINRNTENTIGFPKSVSKARQNILKIVLQNFDEETSIPDKIIENYQGEEENIEIQKQIAEAIFTMPANLRLRIQEKMPIKVLKRLADVYNKHQYGSESNPTEFQMNI